MWKSGNGYQVTIPGLNGGAVVVDPGYIDLGEAGIWSGIKQGLKFATALFGNTDKIQLIKVEIPGDMAMTIATAGDALAQITITNPAGETATSLGKIVSRTGPNYQPNTVNGNVKVCAFQLGNNPDGTPCVIDGI